MSANPSLDTKGALPSTTSRGGRQSPGSEKRPGRRKGDGLSSNPDPFTLPLHNGLRVPRVHEGVRPYILSLFLSWFAEADFASVFFSFASDAFSFGAPEDDDGPPERFA